MDARACVHILFDNVGGYISPPVPSHPVETVEEGLEQQVPRSSTHTNVSEVEPDYGAVVGNRVLSTNDLLAENGEMLEGDSYQAEHSQVNDNFAAELESLSENGESPPLRTEHSSQSSEQSQVDESVKQESSAFKREPLSPELDELTEVVVDEESYGNPIELNSHDFTNDDAFQLNFSCVETDAGDGVAFCTRFKICKSTEEFFAIYHQPGSIWHPSRALQRHDWAFC